MYNLNDVPTEFHRDHEAHYSKQTKSHPKHQSCMTHETNAIHNEQIKDVESNSCTHLQTNFAPGLLFAETRSSNPMACYKNGIKPYGSYSLTILTILSTHPILFCYFLSILREYTKYKNRTR